MTSDAVNEATKKEWRKLGFFYDLDHRARAWRLIGSRSGLLRLRDALLECVADLNNAEKSQHEHYGPYMYLEIMTWPEAGFDDHAIRGPLRDLQRLAELLETKVAMTRPGETVRIKDEFAPNSPYTLILEVREDSFDPAAEDPMLRSPTEGAKGA